MSRAQVFALIGAGCAAAAVLAQAPGPTREDAYRANNLGVARLEQFEYAAAVEEFRRALQIDRDLAIARVNLAIALFHAGELEAARQEADAARLKLTELPHPKYVAGLIARAENRTNAALAAFEAVRRANPEDVGTAINIGQIHLQEGRYAEAVEAFDVALRSEPYSVTASYGRAMALVRSGAREEAAAAMRRFQELRDSGYGTTYSQNYLEQGQYAEAIASTGAEPDLVDDRTPVVVFHPELKALEAAGSRSGNAISVNLLDYDADGDLDLLTGGERVRLYRRDTSGYSDATASAGLDAARGRAVLGGDYDNDGLADLCILAERGIALYRQEEPGRFRAVTPPGLEYGYQASSAAWLDVDHDGDLDLFVASGTARAPSALFRNNGNGTFADIAKEAGLRLEHPIAAIVPTDYDNRRDIDVLVVAPERAPLLFRNLRDGTFRDAAGEVGLVVPGGAGSVAAGDINKDGLVDFLFVGGTTAALALSDKQGRYSIAPAPGGLNEARSAQFVDYDNDGLLDIVATSLRGVRFQRNSGSRWGGGGGAMLPPDVPASAVSSIVAGDIDADGDVDLVTGGERVTVWMNEGGANRAVRVNLSARVSNRSAAGAKVEIRAGSLYQKLEVANAWPPPTPAGLLFGLGRRESIDVVRVLWPAGILQAEIGAAPNVGEERGVRTFTIEELDRKPSSCPFLFTWNGDRFEFITDFLGGGEMGYWLAPGIRNVSDPDEYVRIDSRKLKSRKGRFELRITNELEEALFLDRAQLVAITHPAAVEVHPNEGMTGTPRLFELFFVTAEQPPLAAQDGHGHDVLERITHVDRQYPDDFLLEPIRGYAERHVLTLTLPPGRDRLLLLTGWTDYAFSSDNVAAHQAGLKLSPPSLEAQDAGGTWRTAIDNIGFPVGRPQTIVLDLSDLPAGVNRIRLSTTMRVYWDQVRVASRREVGDAVVTRVEPLSASLRWRGFSAELTPDAREPFTYDFDRVSAASPWKLLPGRYTREGDVRELVTRTDDMFVISRPGDEIALAFDAAALPPLPEGWTRTYLLYADGFTKEMDLNSSSPDTLGPLPFHRMTRYPYEAPEAYPSGDVYRDYIKRYNTRIVPRAIPRIEVSARPKR